MTLSDIALHVLHILHHDTYVVSGTSHNGIKDGSLIANRLMGTQHKLPLAVLQRVDMLIGREETRRLVRNITQHNKVIALQRMYIHLNEHYMT